jgi:hypothetical protein
VSDARVQPDDKLRKIVNLGKICEIWKCLVLRAPEHNL